MGAFDMIRIAMFSGPRNISTTIMRAFENRPDTVVSDEPFYGCYLEESGAPHPMREDILAAMETDRKAVARALKAPPPDGTAISFEKHIAFHFPDKDGLGDDFGWLDGARVFHLIRSPRAMVASYQKKYDDVAPIVDSLKLQRKLYEAAPAPVIDAEDALKDPEGMLRALCAALDIPFTDRMLSWPAGLRDSDGAWAPHWYDAVRASTGFKPFVEKPIALSAVQEDIAAACQPDYDFFHRLRLAP